LPQSPVISAKPANGASTQPSATAEVLSPTNGPTAKPLASDADQKLERRSQAEALLVEGETLLQQDRYEDALDRLEDVLALEPSNAEALIKRGMALERLQRMEAALESYDRAIASNGSLTLAYLHKGAVCNRLQRYREALECYERALQTEHKA
jgi:tetratricopeptide (TPR) repeat protein